MLLYIVDLGLFVLLLGALAEINRLNELHHGYYGAIVALVGFVLKSKFLGWVGLVLLSDDLFQHAAQALMFVPRMADFTPIHKVGAWIMSFNWREGWATPIIIVLLMAALAIVAAIHEFGG